MERREVAPCFDCGDMPSELGELDRGEHEYHWYSVFGQRLILCDFCDADFGSYLPEYFGMPEGPCGSHYDLERLERLSNPLRQQDWCCPTCQHRLAFLAFLEAARGHNSA
jgi:hypothetical protein